jgi:alkanesulfonate monooxygenase SsuD/methylene tetrahydromethanopterin reductase-like flavin-dependent oxidoreductase (luciferase family)
VVPPRIASLLGGEASVPFDEKVGQLLACLRGTSEVPVTPRGTDPPEVWLLGTGTKSLEIAAGMGTAFCLSLFLAGPPAAPRVLDLYRERFVPSPELPEPLCAVAFAGVCAETEEEALRIAARRGSDVIPNLVGTPERLAEGIEALRELHGTSHFIFLDLAQTLDDRLRSCELLAEAVRLAPAAPGE